MSRQGTQVFVLPMAGVQGDQTKGMTSQGPTAANSVKISTVCG